MKVLCVEGVCMRALGNDPVHGHASAHVVIDGHPVCLNRVIDSQ